MSRAYHQSELDIARDAKHPAHILPPIPAPHARILDVGCGAGQTLLGAIPHRLAFGIDVDIDALLLGKQWSTGAQFACARAEELPFADGVFDGVWARVSLAYTNIPRSLDEIRRVLKTGGSVWMVLHPAAIPWHTACAGGWKAWLFFAYVAANSLLFHWAGRMFALRGRYESFQLAGSMSRALRGCRFGDIRLERGRHFVITARAD